MKSQVSVLAGVACAVLLAIPLTAAVTAKKAGVHSAWPAETVSGTIMMVNPAQRLVVVETSGGVPFDIVITPHTRVESGNRNITIQDLQQDMNQHVSVKFVPERRGDVARTIQLNG